MYLYDDGLLFPDGNGVNISARSLGKLNVQLVMEQLGGGGHLTMALDNTYGGSLKQIGDRFISTKREGEQEGIGIRSIRSIAEKYGGDIRIEHDERTFKLSVILLLKE